MYNLILQNKNGNQLTFNSLGGAYTITEIEGLNPPEAMINTKDVALIDGVRYNGAKVSARQINIAFAINYSAEYNRIQVYKVLKSKGWIRLFYTSDYRDVFIDGYVTNIDITYFDMKQVVTVGILCPEPYLKSAQQIIDELSVTLNGFHFPFASTAVPELVFGYIDPLASVAIPNYGDVECGLIITLYASESVSNPKIYDYQTQEFIGLNFTFEANDQVTIDTRKGYRTITLLRNGVETNIFNSLMKNSTWLQLPANGGVYVYEVASGSSANLVVHINHYDLYEGV